MGVKSVSHVLSLHFGKGHAAYELDYSWICLASGFLARLPSKKACAELLKFLRFPLSLMAASFAVLGFLMNQPLGWDLAAAAASGFLVTAYTYSLNMLCDREEDLENHLRLNWFVENQEAGKKVTALCAVFGAIISLLVCWQHFAAFALLAFLGTVYSLMKIKRVTLVKNAFTAFSFCSLFLFGAGGVSLDSVEHWLGLSMVILAASILADMRDHEGDAKFGIMTVPVRFGPEGAIFVISSLLVFSALWIVLFNLYALYGALLFMPPALVLLQMKRVKTALSYLVYGLTSLPLVFLVFLLAA